MPHESIGKTLDLILLLLDDQGHTIDELSQASGTTSRNVYYTLNYLRRYGFHIGKTGKRYWLGADSPFFRQVAANVSFSDDEGAYLYKLVEAANDSNRYADSVRNKLARFYNLAQLTDKRLESRIRQNASRLFDAIDRKRVVILHNYSSPHSQTVSDRIVEPFLFMNDRSDVRCYEPASRMNKTFKLARIGRVSIVNDALWSHEAEHRQAFTDLFLFSGEERHRICLRLGRLSYSLLTEEYPLATRYTRPDGPDHWLFETDVVSYAGIGRFIMGLADDIEVLADDGLKQYLQQRARTLYNIHARA